jgi:penicillin-binding protein 1A
MQLARNLYRDQVQFTVGDRSIVRKAKEILTAVRIERTYTKREILEAYLNTVPFLYNAYGIEAAAQTFFSKPAADLDASESAALIGMLAANTTYNPCGDPSGSPDGCEATVQRNETFVGTSANPNAVGRRNVVLSNMNREGVLDDAAYAAARDAPIRLHVNPYSHEDNIAPHFAEVLRLWLRDWIKTRPECQDSVAATQNPDCNIYTAGLVVRTTIDSRMQALATEAVREEMDDLQGIVNRGWGGTSDDGFQYWWRRNTAVVNEYIGQTDRYTDLAGRPWTGRRADLDASVLTSLRGNTVFMDSLRRARTRVEAGLVAIEPASGHIKAWVGGRDFISNKFDHGGQARRQAGSTFKLFAYTAAFHNGYSQQATAVDLPFAWGDWRPQNSGGGYAGVVTLASALAASRNVVAARITQHFGQAEIARTAYQMGIRSPLELTDPNIPAECRVPFAVFTPPTPPSPTTVPTTARPSRRRARPTPPSRRTWCSRSTASRTATATSWRTSRRSRARSSTRARPTRCSTRCAA